MNTAVINVKIEPKVKAQAQRIAESLGLSLSAVINGYLKQLIRTKTITYSLHSAEEPTPYLLDSLKNAEDDIKAGRVISFDKPAKAIKYLDTLIENE